MDVYEAIRKRYSVRKYGDRPISEELLERILDAGRLAPSASNRQDWKFIVVQGEQMLDALAKAADQPFIATAPVILAVVSTNPERLMYCGIPAGCVDCAIAIDHMTLAAAAEDLGTCWIGHFDQDACCELLDVPAGAKIIELLAMGYPAGSPKEKSRKKLSEVVCYEKYE
jgi:nitroreductase